MTQLLLSSDAPTLRPLPNLPVALSSAVGVPADGSYICSGRRCERSAAASAAFSRERSRAVESAGRVARRRRADVGRCPDWRVVRHRPRRRCSQPTDCCAGRRRRAGRTEGTTPGPIVAGSAHAIGQAHILYLAARRGRRIATGDVSYDLARVGAAAVSQRRTHRQRRADRQRRPDCKRRRRSHRLRNRAGRLQQARARGARLDHHRHLPRGDDRRRRVLVPARPAGDGDRVLRRQPLDPVLGGGRQPVRDQHQLDQLPRDSRQGVRDGLAVHDEQAHDRARSDVRRRLDRAAAAPPGPGVGVQLSGDALPSGDPHDGERAVHGDARRRPHERRAVPAGAGDRHDHRHRRGLEHPDHGRVHHRLHGDGRHARGGVDRFRAGHRADGRRAVRHRLRVLLARRRDRLRHGDGVRQDQAAQLQLRPHPADRSGASSS